MVLDIVAKGGGEKGAVYPGALRAILSKGHTFGRCVGTSAGAITMALVAKGYTPDLIDAMTQKKSADGKPLFSTFLDGNILTDLVSVVKQYGLHPGLTITAWLKAKLGDATFLDWEGLDLTVVSTDVTDKEMLVLNKRTAPGMPVYLAVRASMAIPLIFDPVVWLSEWGPYRNRAKTGNYLVDGGCLSNAPLSLLVEDTADNLSTMGPVETTPVVCMYLNDTNSAHMSTLPEFFASVFSTILTASDQTELRDHVQEICYLDPCGIGTLEFDLSQDRYVAANKKSFADMTTYLINRGL